MRGSDAALRGTSRPNEHDVDRRPQDRVACRLALEPVEVELLVCPAECVERIADPDRRPSRASFSAATGSARIGVLCARVTARRGPGRRAPCRPAASQGRRRASAPGPRADERQPARQQRPLRSGTSQPTGRGAATNMSSQIPFRRASIDISPRATISTSSQAGGRRRTAATSRGSAIAMKIRSRGSRNESGAHRPYRDAGMPPPSTPE